MQPPYNPNMRQSSNPNMRQSSNPNMYSPMQSGGGQWGPGQPGGNMRPPSGMQNEGSEDWNAGNMWNEMSNGGKKAWGPGKDYGEAWNRICHLYPLHGLTSFWIIASVLIDNTTECTDQSQSLLAALIFFWTVMVMVSCFTDHYTAFDGNKHLVLLIPFYGPMCFNLPTDLDKDRVYEKFYLKTRDYIKAFLVTGLFVVMVVFLNPISNCLFPSGKQNGTSKIAGSTQGLVPGALTLIFMIIFMCMGPARQYIGFCNHPETCPPLPDSVMTMETKRKGPAVILVAVIITAIIFVIVAIFIR